MDSIGVIEPENYNLPVLPQSLTALENKLETAWVDAYNTAHRLQGLFNVVGALLMEMRGNEDAFAPFTQSGKSRWSDYVEAVLEPKLGISYVRATQIVNAYESKSGICDLLADIERARVAQLIAERFNASLPKNLPTNEAPYRALAGVEEDEKAVVLGIAEMISDKPQVTFTDVKKAKSIHRAVKNGTLKLGEGERLTSQSVDKVLLYDKIVSDCRRLPTAMLMRLEGDIADLIVRRSTNEVENEFDGQDEEIGQANAD